MIEAGNAQGTAYHFLRHRNGQIDLYLIHLSRITLYSIISSRNIQWEYHGGPRTEEGSFWPRLCSGSVDLVCCGSCIQGKFWELLWDCSRSTQFGPKHPAEFLMPSYTVTASNSLTFLMTWTCPLNPVVPLSINGTFAAKHIRFTWRRASRLSSALKTILKPANQSTLNWLSLMFAW